MSHSSMLHSLTFMRRTHLLFARRTHPLFIDQISLIHASCLSFHVSATQPGASLTIPSCPWHVSRQAHSSMFRRPPFMRRTHLSFICRYCALASFLFLYPCITYTALCSLACFLSFSCIKSNIQRLTEEIRADGYEAPNCHIVVRSLV